MKNNPDQPYFLGEVRYIPDGLAVVYDLESFSKFAKQPGASQFVPRLLNRVIQAVTEVITGAPTFWDESDQTAPPGTFPEINGLLQRKYLGDGELLDSIREFN